MLAGLLFLLTSCDSNHENDVRRTAGGFERAVTAEDWAQACAHLAPATRDDLVSSAGKPCDEALAEETLPRPGRISATSVFGTTAQVRYDSETLFLARFDGSWRVVAAGCTPNRPRPYDCLLQGG